MLKNVYVTGGVRTPFGSFNGSLASLTAPQLGAIAVREALRRAGVSPSDVDHVYFGNVVQAGLGQNPARQVSRGAGIPDHIGAITINKVCGSSMRAVIMASQTIQCGDAGLIVAGGCESMTNAPYFLPGARAGYRMGNGELVDGLIHDGLQDAYDGKHMGLCGDMCAAKYGFTRQEQDLYAIASYKRAIAAWDNGFFAGNVVPVEIKTRKETTVVDRDEDLAKFREDKLPSLPPAFGKDGTVSAGNASNIDDGAAAMIVVGEERMRELGLTPRARILGYANAATAPDWFTEAPVLALKALSERLSLKLSDVDLFEINEAFAVVPMLAMKQLGLNHDKVNAYGGAVAIGHPIGATGARIINTLVAGLRARGGRIGIATLCIGGGEADAIALERCD
ncbi:MAG: thiolase family protein [Phycisphaerales bacterium]|nr:MAG: thiolase family protein [Phycisphaerales bacterium]